MDCIQCKGAFKGRADAKYCSTKCRVAFSRNTVTDSKPVTDKSVTDNVTDKPDDNWSVGKDIKCPECGSNKRLSLIRPRSFGGNDRIHWNDGKDENGKFKKRVVIDYDNIICECE